MAGLRDEILSAFERLERRTGEHAQPLKAVVAEVLAHAPGYSESAIRTYVVSVMCAEAPVHHANHTDDLRRVDRGLYARIGETNASERLNTQVVKEAAELASLAEVAPDLPSWYWEGNVQAAIVGGLAAAGWSIRSVSDTASRARGTDIVAGRGEQLLHVEVKGYPSDTYARGDRRGESKPTHPATQARVWFAGALLKGAMLRNDHPEDLVAIGLPAFGTYENLVARVSKTLTASEISVIWVDETGEVQVVDVF